MPGRHRLFGNHPGHAARGPWRVLFVCKLCGSRTLAFWLLFVTKTSLAWRVHRRDHLRLRRWRWSCGGCGSYSKPLPRCETTSGITVAVTSPITSSMRPSGRGPITRKRSHNQMPGPILVAKGQAELYLLPRMANRHGLIAGATGTGKTVTLQRLAEALSRLGVPTFMADVKGERSGISQPVTEKPKSKERVGQLGLKDFQYADCPVEFWDVFGEQGHPVRSIAADMGPLLLSRMLHLNDIQSGVLTLT